MDDLEEKIRKLVREEGVPGDTPLPPHSLPVSGKVYDEDEMVRSIQAVLEGWWTEGKWTNTFEEKLKTYLGVKHCATVNSGSSANLVAFSSLMSPELKERRIQPGDEVITVAAGFPTTMAPIIQNGAVPVFVDVTLGNYNAKIEEVEEAVSSKTKAIVLAHTLGNPFDLEGVTRVAKKHDLWLVEDNCDALGSLYKGRLTGTFGDFSTLSFYPAHHITTAEGGAVLTNNAKLAKISRSMRDWGRDCWCPTGKDNTCNNRYGWQLGDLPEGFDHKYIYSHVGYNLKLNDILASIGVAQMDKLDGFVEKRKANFHYLKKQLKDQEEHFILPEATLDSDPSWFGFPLTLRDEKMDRRKLLEHLNEHGIGTRLLFAGNALKQPMFTRGTLDYRVVGDLAETDRVMNDTFWVGTYPRLESTHLDYMAETLSDYTRFIS